MTGKCKGLERIWMKALVTKSRGTSKYLGGGAKGTKKCQGSIVLEETPYSKLHTACPQG